MNGRRGAYPDGKHSDRLVNIDGNGINFLDDTGMLYYSRKQAERSSRRDEASMVVARGVIDARRLPSVIGGI